MSKHLSIWCGVVVAIFWSSNFNVIRAINSDVSPLDSATLRFSVAALILLLIRGTKRSPYGAKLTRKSMLSLFVIATVGVTIQNFSIFSAMSFTTPVNAAVVQANLHLSPSCCRALFSKLPFRLKLF